MSDTKTKAPKEPSALQLQLLELVGKNPNGIATKDIAKQLSKPVAAVNSPLNSLAKAGKVVVEKTPDGQVWKPVAA